LHILKNNSVFSWFSGANFATHKHGGISSTRQQRTAHTGFPQLRLREVNDSLGRDEGPAKSTYANICCFFVFSAIKQISYAAMMQQSHEQEK
jgi:hypothetical protein